MATISIDGKSYQVDSSKNLLEVVLSLGIDLPYFCWHPALGSVGSCRQCAVKKYRSEDDQQGQLVMACMEPCPDGLILSVDDQEAVDFREQVIEWLMLNHPHDCPICDEGGECHLQDMTVMTGHAYRRTRFKKRTHHNQYLGPCINHEMNRCIQCYRCVRFYDDYAGGDDLQVFSAHDHVYFGRHESGTLESEFSGNLVEVCPTGVFTDKTLKEHYTRKWDLTSAPSVCHHCSLGCNTLAGERYGSLRRILSRFNPEVNGYFLCDRGRFGYEFVNGPHRIRESNPEALDVVKQSFDQGPVMGIGSPRASLESNYLLRELVGPDNFYNGISGQEHRCLQLALDFMTSGPVHTPSLKEVEQFDAVIVIGEDLTNTASMLDLALKQSVRVKPLKQIEKVGIPAWNDAAVREYLQQQKGPLYVLSAQPTKLDGIASKCFRGGPEQLTGLTAAIAHQLNPQAPLNHQVTYSTEFIAEVATALAKAEKPLVITGSSQNHPELVRAAINLSVALYQANNQTGFCFVAAECNSMGVSLMEPKSLVEALDNADQFQSLVILENDLYRRSPASNINSFLEGFDQVVVLDHTNSGTTEKAHTVLASGTFAEADGTLVNNEGRAQRFFQVQASDVGVQESWRWMLEIGTTINHQKLTGLDGFDSIVHDLEANLPQFSGISAVAQPASHRIHGQKISRAPHRYSGRTSMFAHHQVNEIRPPKDKDSPMTFTMEGYRGIPTESTTSFYWSPGWNSAQAINKFRNEISSGRQEAEPGVRLFNGSDNHDFDYLSLDPPAETSGWKIVLLPHIFASEEMSSRSAALSQRAPELQITIDSDDASALNIKHHDQVTITVGTEKISAPAQLVEGWPKKCLGVPVGFPGVPFIDVDADVQLDTGGQ